MALLQAAKSFFLRRPLIANSIVYGTLYVGAEFSQQTVTKKLLTKPPTELDKPTLARYAIMGTFIYSPMLFFCETPSEYDKAALVRFTIYGTCIYPPSLFYWYRWLDRFLPGTARKTIVKKLLMDQFLFTPPLLGVFFTGMSIMEGNPPFEELQQKFVPTFARSCLFWLPAQTANFIFIPPQFRVIYVGACAFAWVNILCWVKRQNFDEEEEAKVTQ